MSEIIALNNDNFEAEVLHSEKPVVIDFGAPWCSQCKALAPLFDEMAEKWKDQIRFATCDVAAAPDIAVRYGIRSVPVFLFLKNGEETDRFYGMISRSELEKNIRKLTE